MATTSKLSQTWTNVKNFAKGGKFWLGGSVVAVGCVYGLYSQSQKVKKLAEERFEDLPFLGPPRKLQPTLVLGTSNAIIGNAWHGPASRMFTFRRPGYDTLIDRLKDKYEIVLYSTSDYAHSSELRARLDPKGSYIQEFVSLDVEGLRDDESKKKDTENRKNKYKTFSDGLGGSNYDEEKKDISKRIEKPQKLVKDLGRNMERVVLVDIVENIDFPYNTIVVPPWDGKDLSDRELFNIIPMLEQLAADKTDMRPKIRQAKQLAKAEQKPTGLAWLDHLQTRSQAKAQADSFTRGEGTQQPASGSNWKSLLGLKF